ncbi:hypothetical protein SHO565_47930 [Streptomyces sp. HO565]
MHGAGHADPGARRWGVGRGRRGVARHPGRRVQREARAAHDHQQGGGAQGVGGVGQHRRQADQGRAEHEGDLVEGALEGQGGAHGRFAGPRAPGEGHQPDPGERTDQRHTGARHRAQGGQRGRRQAGQRAGHERGDRQGVGQAEQEDDRALAVPVREPAHQRAARHLPDGERTAGQSGGGQGAAGTGDEQHTAELDGGRRQPPQERHHGQQWPGQPDDLPVRPQRAVPSLRVRRTPCAAHRSKLATRGCTRGWADDTKGGAAGT